MAYRGHEGGDIRVRGPLSIGRLAQLLVEPGQILIADDPPPAVADNMPLLEDGPRTKEIRVNPFHDRKGFFKPILNGCTGESNPVIRDNLVKPTGTLRLRILQTCGFINDRQITQLTELAPAGGGNIVADDHIIRPFLERLIEKLLPAFRRTINNQTPIFSWDRKRPSLVADQLSFNIGNVGN